VVPVAQVVILPLAAHLLTVVVAEVVVPEVALVALVE
jgi:hypothetical protein